MAEHSLAFDKIVRYFRSVLQDLPDKRTGKNTRYTLEDAALGAFSVFFTQTPSFLAYQRAMQKSKGKSNAQTLLGMHQIPSDNHIRDLLDEVAPSHVFPVFSYSFTALKVSGRLAEFGAFEGQLLLALDGTQYFCSSSIHCKNCSTRNSKEGKTLYAHNVITPVIVAPGHTQAMALAPEFITPQDGHNKQDCETTAAKRWVVRHAKQYRELGITVLGDDLYCRQPFYELLLEEGLNFILVCKPDSHKTLYECLAGLPEKAIHTVVIRRWNGKVRELYTYRYAHQLPLRDTEDTLFVNWCEVTIAREDGAILYQNAFVTNHPVTDLNVEGLMLAGRTRWKIENENTNTLKTKGYNLEHNYGHGKKYLSSLLATLNILAFLFHTLLDLTDEKYRLIRSHLPTRKTFFDDLRALTRYLCFNSWDDLLSFMIRGLEIQVAPNTS